ncbi:MAG: 50S ribosomal protein L18 [Candidatus Magasanikbacteria bacterium RIFOXYD2_FULL_41_14]|uniref:Large ribosomal subunit protein uL18 n=1 Tax=Candidatus Magasanikbacteria bacterium RIFOXYD2_FULL_41_14 TaxID=1798709 RepID=A0A1F6PBY2_9BACT|nr:MAG: 50S ribosomal protein L18 [Candidatus Magasanikbacteria bacterium RIFOXYD2_FULL_41_14]
MKRSTNQIKSKLRAVRHARVRARVIGSADCPRLSVFRSLRGVVAQLIDDKKGGTLCYVDSSKLAAVKSEKYSAKISASYEAGKKLAELAQAKKIKKVVFDRGGYRYHGRVAALAEGARAGGLEF